MADPGPTGQPGQAAARRFLTFRLDRRLYALPAEDVTEVIRMPAVARVPQGPKGLLGIANLRGAVLPVASLRGLLGHDIEAGGGAARAIVMDGAAPVALAVDRVEALVAVDAASVTTTQAQLAAEPGELLVGAFQAGDSASEVARILDLPTLLAAAFVQRTRPQRRAVAGVAATHDAAEAADDHRKLVTFDVAGQEYALELEAVREIIPAPEGLAAVPGADALVLGVTGYRGGLLPLLSLRGLLGLPIAATREELAKVVVTAVGGVLVGLVADRMRSIVPADAGLIEPTPLVLAARTGGEARIKAIYRGEAGRRLISILAPEQLFRDDVMQRLGKGAGEATPDGASQASGEARRFLVFRLGDGEFGLPIEAVDEVAEVPNQITRLPRTPKFLEGVVNLRGEVLPVVDQRRRFDMPALEDGARRRLVVVRTDRHRAGLIVDSVSEVLGADAHAIEAAPDLTGEATRLVNGVINLEAAGRMILVLDPGELLSRAERGLLDTFQDKARQAAP
jgi:purine-binding chemotaxis protein CheW